MYRKRLLLPCALLLSGCASNIDYVKYEPPTDAPTADVTLWVDHFRNSAGILFRTYAHYSNNQKVTAYELGALSSGSLFDKPVRELKLELPANRPFQLYYKNISSSGHVTKTCSGTTTLHLESGRTYRIEFVNWRPKDPTSDAPKNTLSAVFSCELDIGELMPDGSLRQILYVKP